jgi:hypothetical protein
MDFAVRHRYVVLSLSGLLLYTAFIGLRDVWYPDEPDIAEVALAMFLSGDWTAPRRMGVVWVDYPPMIYWIGAASSQLFGEMTAFTLRLPNALTAIAIVLLTSATASRWYDARTGLWSGFALLTCLLFVYEANSYRPDIWFTLGIASGMILYAEGVLGERRAWLCVAAFACFAGVRGGLLTVGCRNCAGHGLGQHPVRILRAEFRPLRERISRPSAGTVLLPEKLLAGFFAMVVAVSGGADLDNSLTLAWRPPHAIAVVVVRHVFRFPVNRRDETPVVHVAGLPGICTHHGTVARGGHRADAPGRLA